MDRIIQIYFSAKVNPNVSGNFKPVARNLSRSGFTLVELLVVVGIIAVLVGLLIVGIGAAQRRAQQVNTQFLMSSISQALARFKSDHGYYPPILGDPSTLRSTLWLPSGTTPLPSTLVTQVGYSRDLLLPPTNTAIPGQTTKVGQWSTGPTGESTALQNWNSITSLAEYLLGAGDRSQDGYGICGELPDPVPADLLPGQRELPRAGIRSPGLDGVWGAAIQPLMSLDYNSTSATPNAGPSYSGATMGNPTANPPKRGHFFMRNLALPSQILVNTTTPPSGLGNDTNNCILRCRPNLEGKIFGPYLELKDPSIIGAYRGMRVDPLDPTGVNQIPDIVRATDGDPDFDKYPKVLLDYWGQPIRYYRRGYVNLMPNTPDQATDGTKFDLGDFFALRPSKVAAGDVVPDAQARTDVLDDENPDLQLTPSINGKDRTSTPRLRSAEFALLSSGPDKRIDRTRRIGFGGPNKDIDVNADNIVETGP